MDGRREERKRMEREKTFLRLSFSPQETELNNNAETHPLSNTHTYNVRQRLTQGQVVPPLLLEKFSGSLGPFRNGGQQLLQGSACS